MAGGGTTNDACLLLGRRCRSYDIKPKRVDIEKHDIAQGFPTMTQKCDFIFLDPPYWRLQKDHYSEDSASFVSLEGWLEFMGKLAEECRRTIKENGYIALLIEAFLDEKVTQRFLDLPFECLKLFTEVGFTEEQRIATPMPSQIKDVHDVEYGKRSKLMLDLNRDLIVLRAGM
jgi:DNA modification methylase